LRRFQKEAGNYTMVGNELENVFIKGVLSRAEEQVLRAVNRLTVGFMQYAQVDLSSNDLADLTGLSSRTVKEAVKVLVQKRFLIKVQGGKKRSLKNRYEVNYDSGEWEIADLSPIKPVRQNYEGCEFLTSDGQNTGCHGTGEAENTKGSEAGITTTSEAGITGFDERTQASTDAVAGERKGKKEKEKRLRLLLEDEDLFSLLRTKAELESRGLISYDEALWQTVHFLERLFRRTLTDNHLALLADFFPEDNGRSGLGKELLSFIHSGYAKTIALNKKLESEKLNPVGDPIAKAISLASDVFAERFYEAKYSKGSKSDDDVEDDVDEDLPPYFDQIYNPNEHIDPELRQREAVAEAMDPVARRRAEGMRIFDVRDDNDDQTEEAC